MMSDAVQSPSNNLIRTGESSLPNSTNLLVNLSNMAVIRELAGPPSLTTGLLCAFLIGFTNYITFQSTTGPTTTSQPPRTLSDLAPPCCRLAFEHSYGLIDDIPDATWREHYQQPSLNPRRYGDARGPNDVNSHIPTYYIFEQLDPWFSCPGRHRLGGLGDGPKFTCNPHRVKELMEQRDTLAGSQPKAPRLGLASALTLGRSKSDKPYDCLVYSFLGGKRDNYRWEESLAELLDGRCEIHIFDFELTHGKSEWTNNALYRNVVFHPWRLHSSQGSSSYFEGTGGVSTADHTALSFRDVQHRLGHEGRTIDLFKMDCIGCEWCVNCK